MRALMACFSEEKKSFYVSSVLIRMTPESRKSMGKYFLNHSFLKLMINLGVFVIFLFSLFYEWLLDTEGEINDFFP